VLDRSWNLSNQKRNIRLYLGAVILLSGCLCVQSFVPVRPIALYQHMRNINIDNVGTHT
jgi:hypothetical protein